MSALPSPLKSAMSATCQSDPTDPTVVLEATWLPSICHIATWPLSLCSRMSALPSLPKSPIPSTCQPAGMDPTVAFEGDMVAVELPKRKAAAVVAEQDVADAVAIEVVGSVMRQGSADVSSLTMVPMPWACGRSWRRWSLRRG